MPSFIHSFIDHKIQDTLITREIHDEFINVRFMINSLNMSEIHDEFIKHEIH